jgi:hypothetical protein
MRRKRKRSCGLRWAGMALGAVMLPLAIVAAISMGKRIGQYGFTPDRLWATVVVAVTVAAAGTYLFALIRGRFGWAAHVRRYNVAFAAGICLLALFLALPIVNFGAISTRDQLALLDSGKIAPDRFDWRAMRFDFGPSGVAALERLRDSGKSPAIKALAARSASFDQPLVDAGSERWVRDRQASGRGPYPSPTQVRHIAKLARIAMSDAEVERWCPNSTISSAGSSSSARSTPTASSR